ncbi:MAG: IS110 family transposase [Bacilli bacterium]
MEVIYKKTCGVDVHKSFIVAVICDSTSITPKYSRKRFSTFNNDLVRFKDWLIDNDCQNVCMESTGKYYVPVYNALEGYISNVVVANPKWVKAIKGEKDDNKDAKWIADLFKMGLVRSSYIPSKDFRILREFTRYRYKLTNTKSSEKNRFTNALTVGNCKLDMVFTDIFGKSSQSIIDIILSNDNFSDEDIINCISKKCKSSNKDILSSINGIQLTDEQKLRIKFVKEHIDYLNNQIDKLDKIIDSLVAPYESYIDLLCTIPGIDRKSAISILSEISNDMSQFNSHYRLTSWAGLAPGCNESAGKKKSVKISRAGVYLKPYLVEVAHCAVKDKSNSYYAKKFEKISKRRGKKRAYIAIARKILVAIYHMFETGEVWNPVDLISVETPVADRIKYTKNNFNQSLKQLLSLGLTSEELINLINQNANKLPV